MDKLTLDLYIISRLTHNFYARELRKIGITMGQFPFLAGIYESDGVSQEKLSSEMLISKSMTAAVVRQLLSAGLVTREVDENDRRNFRLHLTDGGKKLIPEIHKIIRSCHASITAALSEPERTEYRKLTRRIRIQSENSLIR